MLSSTTVLSSVTSLLCFVNPISLALSDQSAPGRVLFTGNFFLNNAVAGFIEIPTLFGCVWLMKYGRKRAQQMTLVGGGIAIIIAMLAVVAHHYMFALFFMMLGKIFIQVPLTFSIFQ